MSGLLHQALVALCSLTVACPPALCCYVLPLACCSDKAPQATQPEKPKCSHCSRDQAAAKPARPAKAPQPAEPGPQCCCDRQPATPPDAKTQVPEPTATHLLADLPTPMSAPTTAVWVVDFPLLVLPSGLHVLHCLWLC